MPQIIRENRPPSFLERLIPTFQQSLNEVSPIVEKRREQDRLGQETARLSELTGFDLSGLSKENLSPFAKEFATQLRPQSGSSDDKDSRKQQQSVAGLEGAMNTVNRMREIRKKGNLGFGSSVTGIFNPEIRKDSGEYKQLGKSLIQFATTIPIRNRLEFETLAESLYDPTITDAEAEGTLDSMERIINNSLSQYSMDGTEASLSQMQQPKKERRPLGSFAK